MPSTKRKKLTIICGGPSAERGISLNSARSLFDNLDKQKYDVSIIYFNPHLQAFAITPAQIYSNTPLDFDYMLAHSKQALDKKKLTKTLKRTDLVFPVIHGLFGEDGQLQTILETVGVNYIGSSPQAMQNTSNKALCQQILQKCGFHTFAHYVVKKRDALPKLPPGKYVIKPLHGGSSIGVHYFESAAELQKKWHQVFQHEAEAIIEPYCNGQEFTIIVLQNADNQPVALFPTEIVFSKDRFFDYRKKYLASTETRYYTPARFDNKTIQHIRRQAEKAFTCLGMKDFARLDGWILKDGKIWFSDVNGISGLEQNSFIFQQAALFGLSHRQLLDYLINKKIDKPVNTEKREEIPVIFGGDVAERQVSIMSGTNVWIKLKSSQMYKPVPLFLSFEQKIFYIPPFFCLHHTVEEIEEKIRLFQQPNFLKHLQEKLKPVYQQLQISANDTEEQLFVPTAVSLEAIAKKYSFLFLGLHGGAGENGAFQHKLDKLKLPYNGPGAACSRLCMDKFATGEVITNANIEGVRTAKKSIVQLNNTPANIWNKLQREGFPSDIIIKPPADGCSAGVLHVDNVKQFKKAMTYFKSDNLCIPEKVIHAHHGRIDLPPKKLHELLIEEYIATDKVIIKNLQISWEKISDLIEVTIGVIGKKTNLKVFYPSQSIASQEVLSLEEKFMGGTGINFTPPPTNFVNPKTIKKAQARIKIVAETLGIEGYARIDAFMNIKTGKLIIIEANTLPALTPSTVIFHQALAENPSMTPLQFIEKIIEFGKYRFQ